MVRSLFVAALAAVLGAAAGSANRPGARPLRAVVLADTVTDTARALAGIRALHRADSLATLAGDPDALAALWDDNGVRMEPGGPAVVGREAMRTADRRFRAAHPGSGMVRYAPHLLGVDVHGDWAAEWGYFDGAYVAQAGARPTAFRGNVLRVLRQQPDGAWKFSRVMWNPAR